MRNLVLLLIHAVVTVIRLMRPGGARAVVAETVLMRHQLLVLNRARKRAPDLRHSDRIIAGLCSMLIRPARLARSAIVLKPATILRFHRALAKRKYSELFTRHAQRVRPGPKGPSSELVAAIMEMKRRNPRFGYQRIADQIALAFGITVEKDVVRRVLAKYYRPDPGAGGPSWLRFLGHSKDSLWSVDLFCCESLLLKTHWVMVVMDQCTRRIVGFAVHRGRPDGQAACRMLGTILSGAARPTYLSSDNDPVFAYHRWKANLRVLDIEEIKTVPYVPLSHPFVERLIGTIRREYLDHVPFWTATDLDRKLARFQRYYNEQRVHKGLGGATPAARRAQSNARRPARLANFRWARLCHGLYQLPTAA